MDTRNTINSILESLQDNLPFVAVGDYIETNKTFYPPYDFKDKNIVIEGVKITPPLCASESTKKILIQENSCLLETYNDTLRGDILRVVKTGHNKVLVENLSVKPAFRKSFEIEKLDIIKGNFNVIKRKSVDLIKAFENILS